MTRNHEVQNGDVIWLSSLCKLMQNKILRETANAWSNLAKTKRKGKPWFITSGTSYTCFQLLSILAHGTTRDPSRNVRSHLTPYPLSLL
ncbi:hypothetical protein F511_30390 [Dorcoceras hygrometricum]|uniref:Uncharacterized protein n=1 Tax=Dorcoceras hygrometricum TaxID=472368 RepID=A0A2Z7BHZ3_9LAMI|nr:hypothetical protein F511_30390 [Dorcoceras hygrometricum]